MQPGVIQTRSFRRADSSNPHDTDQQLRLLNTRLGELLAQAAEVSVGSDTTSDLGSAVDDVVTQLESLRLAVEDVNNPRPGGAGQASASP